MGSYRVISADDHIFEPPDLWTSRLGRKYGDRVPRVVRTKDGGDWWVTDGIKGQPISAASLTGERFEGSERLSLSDLEEHVRPGAYDPEERLKDMELDGVDMSILYPNAGFLMYWVPDTEFLNDVFQIYNDWIAEYCKPYPKKLIGIGMLNLDDVEWAVTELQRCHKLGLSGTLIPVAVGTGKTYDSPEYEPFWAAAQDLGMPLSVHAGTNRVNDRSLIVEPDNFSADANCNVDNWARSALSQLIFAGVFERHPELLVGSVEFDLSWAATFLQRMDYTYTQMAQRTHWHRFKEDALPSDYFHRNVFMGFQEDGLGIRLRDIIGVDKLQWGSDYPHQESTFPRSRQILDEILVDCTEEEKAKIAGGNAARVYHLD